MPELLPGFDRIRVDTGALIPGGVTINARTAGSGPPVLLLHGYPQTHIMWHRVAPDLAQNHTVVVADLRGYGDSDAPASGYSKREMAADQVALMKSLGHNHFAVVGHDRGGRVAHRMALDHPAAVASVAVLDIVPTLHMFDTVDRAMAAGYFHWFFLTVGGGLPEALIGAAPQAWLDSRFAGRHAGGLPLDPAALAEYARCFAKPEVIHASCEDYRDAATIDLDHDRTDRTVQKRVTAPLLALWGQSSYVGRNFDVPAVWGEYADQVTGLGIEADHYLAEEAPEPVITALRTFLQTTAVGEPR